MNISSLKDFEHIAYIAWQEKHIFLAHVHGGDGSLLQPSSHPGSLLIRARYHQEIQNQGFFPCVIDCSEKRDSEEWEELVRWLENLQRPFIGIFRGERVSAPLIPNCIDYYISPGERSTLKLQNQRPSKDRLREHLLRFFQTDIRRYPLESPALVAEILEHIAKNYPQHRAHHETLHLLDSIVQGLEGTMPDSAVFLRQLKWDLFAYLSALKGRF